MCTGPMQVRSLQRHRQEGIMDGARLSCVAGGGGGKGHRPWSTSTSSLLLGVPIPSEKPFFDYGHRKTGGSWGASHLACGAVYAGFQVTSDTCYV